MEIPGSCVGSVLPCISLEFSKLKILVLTSCATFLGKDTVGVIRYLIFYFYCIFSEISTSNNFNLQVVEFLMVNFFSA